MLPSIGFMEMIVLALLAIIVVGPEDLPKLMRSIGRFMAKIRGLAQEFRQAFDEMGEASEVAELRREIDELKQMGKLANFSDDDLEKDLRDLDQDIRDGISSDNPKSSPANEDKA